MGSRFIVIEGLIGVGKTTLCRLLAEKMKAELILEPAEDNPFLAQFYDDPERYAFPAQMFYLATRCRQQNQLFQPKLFSELFVSDYLFDKDRIFAEQTLDGEEMELYNLFSSLLAQNVAKPDFVLFLDSPTDVILNRIKRRAIEAEQVIEGRYLNELRERYYDLWDRYDDAPIYVLNTQKINYVDDPDGEEEVLALIQGWLDGSPLPHAPKAYKKENLEQLPLFRCL